MHARGLKNIFSVDLAILLLVAMLLINLVVSMIYQRHLVLTELARAELVLSLIEEHFPMEKGAPARTWQIPAFFERHPETLRDCCVLVVDENARLLSDSGTWCADDRAFRDQLKLSLKRRRPINRLAGEVWGIFWKQPEAICLTTPIRHQRQVIAAAGVSLQLSPVYRNLRTAQPVILIYIAANTLILTLLGLYRLSRTVIKPLQRLAKRAEEFQDPEGAFFLQTTTTNEFGRLSTGLNRMLQRITADRAKLKKTVVSLEKANKRLHEAQQDIIRAEKLASVGRLSAGVAHEIGNPIGIVLGYMGLLRKSDLPDADRQEYLDRIEGEINRINAIIRELLDFSRPTGGEPRPSDVQAILTETLSVVQVQPQSSGIDIKTEFKPPSALVLADPNRLKQVFLNILINAVDAVGESPEKGRIQISGVRLETPPDYLAEKDCGAVLQLRFSDNGPGIRDENLDSLFDPFFTTKPPGKGTGLGLSVCHMIIEQMGGWIQVRNNPDQGVTITIYLPLQEKEMET